MKSIEFLRRNSLQCTPTTSGDNSRLLSAKEPRHTKICKLGHHMIIQQYILGFKVQMNNPAFRVKVMQAAANPLNYIISYVPLKSTRFSCRSRQNKNVISDHPT